MSSQLVNSASDGTQAIRPMIYRVTGGNIGGQRLRGDVGGRGLIEKAGDAVALVPVEHDGILRDLDVPAAST